MQAKVATKKQRSGPRPGRAVPLDEAQLMAWIIQNLEHIRHVENERLTFVSLFLVAVAMLLEFSVGASRPTAILLGCLVVLLHLVCIFLLLRWRGVINAHRAVIERLCTQHPAPKGLSACDPNALYLHSYKIYANPRGKKWRDRLYIKTTDYFFLLVGFILAFAVYYFFFFLGIPKAG